MFKKKRLAAAAIILLAALSVLDHAGLFGYRGNDRHIYHEAYATVTYAADGDTLDVDIPDRRRAVTRIRLWGVDCPEIAHDESESDAWFGQDAARFVRSIVVGQRVRLALDPIRETRDKYGRLLAYVYLADSGRMLNELLIERGLAYADRRFPHVFKHRFVQREKAAAKLKTGLWQGITPEKMPDWRRRMDAAGAR